MEEARYTTSGRAPAIIGAILLFLTLSTITTVLRIYVRTRMIKTFGIDDWLSVIGYLLFIVYGGCIITGIEYGVGQHMDKILPLDLGDALKWWWIGNLVNGFSYIIIKWSIALQLLRYVVEPWQRYLVLTMIIVMQLYSFAIWGLYIWQCSPPSFIWTRLQGDTLGTCMPHQTIKIAGYVYSGLSCIVDWTMAIIPWLMVRKLQLDTRTKLMVSAVLGLGSIASIATVIRLPYIVQLSATNTRSFFYLTGDVLIWSACEIGLSITASSAVTLKPLIKTYRAKCKERGSQPDNLTGTTLESHSIQGRSEKAHVSEISIG